MEPWFDDAEIEATTKYLRSGGWITEFKKTEELEKMLADYTGAKHCIMVTNGTISLVMALLALDIKAGDEVLIPNLTMIASPNSCTLIGAKPVFVDIEPDTLCMDLDKAKKAITKKTKALMYVALNGRSADMKKVLDFCRANNLFLIEDAAQALGCFQGKHLGTFGEIGSLSFSVPKIITMGQGGALLTNDDKLNKKIRSIKDFGRARGGIDIHDEMGWNFKITDLQAVIGIEQMKKLDFRVKRKKEIYKRYEKNLKAVKQVEFIKTNLQNTSPWFIDIYVPNPDGLSSFLKEVGIGTRKVYPAIHTQKIYQDVSDSQNFPVSSQYANRGLWLPSSSKLTNKEIDLICEAITSYFESTQKIKTSLLENHKKLNA